METVKIVCPHCVALNAIAAEVKKQEVLCESCGKPLNDTTPVECDAATFERHLTENEIAILVDFYSPDCGPCMQMAPDYAAAAEKFALEVRFLKINVFHTPEIARRYGVNELPTMIAFLNGTEANRFAMALPKSQLEMWAESLIQMDYR